MKKIKVITILLIILFPLSVFANDAKTLRQLRGNLSGLQREKRKQDSSVRYTKSEIQSRKNDIIKAETNITDSEYKIALTKKNIETSSKKLEELKTKAKEIMTYYEIMSNNDTYYEYVTNTSSMTELIMRQDAINIIMQHNKDRLTEIEKAIEDNKQEEVNLKKYQNELERNIKTFENNLQKLSFDLSSLVEITEDINDQIKNQNALIKYYESIGCKEDQLLSECDRIANNRGWLKPLVRGTITSLFGYRKNPITGQTSSFHNGIDIGVAEGTNVYSATAGKVAAITHRASCGGNKVYIYSKVNGVNYTITYLHLLTINVKLGQTVTTDTIIGKSGGGSTASRNGGYDRCTTGAHLHFGVATGFYLTEYKSYSTYVAKSIKPPGFPGLRGTFNSRTQWFG